MAEHKTVLPLGDLYECCDCQKQYPSHQDAAKCHRSLVAVVRSTEQPEDTSSDLRERILDEIEDPADCEHGHPSCAKCLYERRERLLREAADSLNRTEQANSRIEITDEMVEKAAAAIMRRYVDCGAFADDDSSVTAMDRDAARKGLEAALNG